MTNGIDAQKVNQPAEINFMILWHDYKFIWKIGKQEHKDDKSLMQGHIRLWALASEVKLQPRNPGANDFY